MAKKPGYGRIHTLAQIRVVDLPVRGQRLGRIVQEQGRRRLVCHQCAHQVRMPRDKVQADLRSAAGAEDKGWAYSERRDQPRSVIGLNVDIQRLGRAVERAARIVLAGSNATTVKSSARCRASPANTPASCGPPGMISSSIGPVPCISW